MTVYEETETEKCEKDLKKNKRTNMMDQLC